MDFRLDSGIAGVAAETRRFPLHETGKSREFAKIDFPFLAARHATVAYPSRAGGPFWLVCWSRSLTNSEGAKMNNTQNMKTNPVLICAVVASTVVGSVFGGSVAEGLFGKGNTSPHVALSKASDEINRTTPKMIDSVTRLDSTIALPDNTFVYKLTLVGVDELPDRGLRRRDQTRDGKSCLLYTSPSPRDQRGSRMPSSA